jgi:hypothetical protein
MYVKITHTGVSKKKSEERENKQGVKVRFETINTRGTRPHHPFLGF